MAQLSDCLSSSLKKLSAKGLIPLSLFAALATGTPVASAQQEHANTPPGIHSSLDDDNKLDISPQFGAKLYQDTTFAHHTGQWVGRTISEANPDGAVSSPQLHEYFLTDNDVLLQTTVKTTGKATMQIDSSEKLPAKVADALRSGMASMPADMVFSHFSR